MSDVEKEQYVVWAGTDAAMSRLVKADDFIIISTLKDDETGNSPWRVFLSTGLDPDNKKILWALAALHDLCSKGGLVPEREWTIDGLPKAPDKPKSKVGGKVINLEPPAWTGLSAVNALNKMANKLPNKPTMPKLPVEQAGKVIKGTVKGNFNA